MWGLFSQEKWGQGIEDQEDHLEDVPQDADIQEGKINLVLGEEDPDLDQNHHGVQGKDIIQAANINYFSSRDSRRRSSSSESR